MNSNPTAADYAAHDAGEAMVAAKGAAQATTELAKRVDDLAAQVDRIAGEARVLRTGARAESTSLEAGDLDLLEYLVARGEAGDVEWHTADSEAIARVVAALRSAGRLDVAELQRQLAARDATIAELTQERDATRMRAATQCARADAATEAWHEAAKRTRD